MINQRIAALRQQMEFNGVDAWIIPSNDPHQSEYVADHWKGREWISGFTGSAGTAVVTDDYAGLWTDSRYFLQAEEQLAQSEFVMHKLGERDELNVIEWLCEELEEGGKVGADPWLFSVSQWRHMERQLGEWDIELVPTGDLLKEVWKDRPHLPKGKVFEQPVRFAGLTRLEKMEALREMMREEETTMYLITALDDIAWMFNIRGNDVSCNPVAVAYAVIGMEKSWLFLDEEKVEDLLKLELSNDEVTIEPYSAIIPFLEKLGEEETLYLHPGSVSQALADAVEQGYVVEGSNWIMETKAIKNETEIKGIRKAMYKDGIALTRFFRWLEKTLEHRGVKETEAAEVLAGFRAEQENYYGESFDAIVGYQGNGAIVHYRAEPDTCATIRKEGILLLDSGGQYLEGTTDITRTFALGIPTAEQKRNYTLVLKGHIALDQAVFPEGTLGVQLDILARQYLWQHHLNYGHGTGHGVGVFLNVHEPPQGFVPGLTRRGRTAFKAGMFTSNEPGYYKTGEYGIRIENLVLTVSAGNNGQENFLRLENMTLYPIDQTLLEISLLTVQEMQWLNTYHERVYQALSPGLDKEEKEWLAEKCKPISKG